MLLSLFYWPQLALGLFVFFHNLLHFIVGNSSYTIYISIHLKKKLEHKYTLTPLDPRMLYLGPIQAKRYLFVRDTYPDLYGYLSVLCILYLAACGTVRHLSNLCRVGKLPMHTMQCLAASNLHYLAFCIVYIVFKLICDHIYQNYIGLLYV